MEKQIINPWSWQDSFGYSQAIRLRDVSETLVLAGQTAMSADGVPQHPGDMAAQLELTMDNIDTVLAEAGFELADVVRLNLFTTDVDALLAAFGTVAGRLAEAGCRPASTLLGVSRLAFPDLLVEIEVTACR